MYETSVVRMLALTTPIGNRYMDWKGRNKMPLLVDSMVVYEENSKEFTEKVVYLVGSLARLQDTRSIYEN